MAITGTFQISNWQESVTTSMENNCKISNAVVDQSYSGDIIGTSQIHYQLYYNSEGNARFTGYEVLTLTEDQSKKIILQHAGKFEGGSASAQLDVIDCNFDDNLIGKTGNFISKEGGKADYRIG
ncbi:DUF3224 domain-containing protein [Pseudoalteromonas luteoviolacea]|uniref:DUF3224 domain-containing protein n=1 Tax=Pseudoalteromonas luteoviolacea (strain 2ta16) TaxID=1353533 RepID=V4HX64_PSEL2|nr:DUF3224 domain-containing protein [Pseudoalteromonas luteoviolacea]ESP94368.1 protein of unknown function (DUF3224) [Pseudoalteromonas luteoviolacea 2ta16]KZN32062.1 hypothetical protein N483_02680 [Pseudoalteromonas luteoviolacea NCIMB 1944]